MQQRVEVFQATTEKGVGAYNLRPLISEIAFLVMKVGKGRNGMQIATGIHTGHGAVAANVILIVHMLHLQSHVGIDTFNQGKYLIWVASDPH